VYPFGIPKGDGIDARGFVGIFDPDYRFDSHS
jgi:hypothetical protein